MNEPDRSELERLKQRQARLEQELSLLGTQLKLLETKLDAAQPTAPVMSLPPRIVVKLPDISQPEIAGTAVPVEAPRPIPIPPRIESRIPSGIPVAPPPAALPGDPAPVPVVPPSPAPAKAPRVKLRIESGEANFLKGLCVGCGGHIEFPASALGDTVLCPQCNCSTRLSVADQSPPMPPRLAAGGEPVSPPPQASFEMRLGTFWLVRIGIVLLLTALVFFGTYAYQNFIGLLGPGGKISLLYLASALLLGAGAWWQRRSVKESLKNYAQVLFAGGLAAVYFTTYAAHHFPNLRVIQSALLDGALLLGWAGFIAWLADRKKSEVLALFAVGLAYYTSVITRVGAFTLYSNLVLTLAAVFFLVRNRWATLSFASLVATYASYAWWRFFHGSEGWRWADPQEGLWFGAYFLMSYWLVFTAAVFLTKHEKLAGQNRASFLTLNNGAFFTLFLLTMLQVHHGGLWKLSLTYGAVLLALAEAARRVFASEPLTKNSYLTQGLLLVTVGIISKILDTERTLALVLAAESVVLSVLGTQRRSLILQIGGYIAGALAVGWGIDGLEKFNHPGLYTGAAIGALMVFNAFWAGRADSTAGESSLRPVPAFFTLLALVIWVFTTWFNTTAANLPLVLAIEALLLTLSIHTLRVPEVVLLGQGCLVLALATWHFHVLGDGAQPPWWNPLLMIAVTLGLGHWWQRQKTLATNSQVGVVCQFIYALGIVGLLGTWLHPKVEAPTWLALVTLLGVGVTAYGVFTRAWLLAACGQILVLVGCAQFALQLGQGHPVWYFPLAPMTALWLLSFSTVNWFARKPQSGPQVRGPLLQIALIYRWAALFMALWWVGEYIPRPEQIWTLTLVGFLIFGFAGWRQNREALLFGAVFSAAALAVFWARSFESGFIYWPVLLVVLTWLAQHQIARRLPARFTLDERAHTVVMLLGGLSLWRYVSCWVKLSASGFYLTATWSALALGLFACGIALRERIYRWLGLGVLAAALGRIVIFDVWKLETLYRILSFTALGVVLLVLGFIYNKYQEKIRQWL